VPFRQHPLEFDLFFLRANRKAAIAQETNLEILRGVLLASPFWIGVSTPHRHDLRLT
jgi:hypothetical protein